MGLFRDIGERVERFKQEVTDVAEDEAAYECRDCGELLYAERDRCPNCDADAVMPRAPEPEESGDGASDAKEPDVGEPDADASNGTDDEALGTGDEVASEERGDAASDGREATDSER